MLPVIHLKYLLTYKIAVTPFFKNMIVIELMYHSTLECLDYFIALKKLIIFQLYSPLIDKGIPLVVNSIFISIEIGLRKMQLSKYKQIKVVNLPLVL